MRHMPVSMMPGSEWTKEEAAAAPMERMVRTSEDRSMPRAMRSTGEWALFRDASEIVEVEPQRKGGSQSAEKRWAKVATSNIRERSVAP